MPESFAGRVYDVGSAVFRHYFTIGIVSILPPLIVASRTLFSPKNKLTRSLSQAQQFAKDNTIAFGTASFIVGCFVAALLALWDANAKLQTLLDEPDVTFEVDSGLGYVIPPSARPEYDADHSWAVRFKLNSSKSLEHACVYVTGVSKMSDSTFRPIDVPWPLGLYGSNAFDCSDLPKGTTYYVLFHGSLDGHHIALFVKPPLPGELFKTQNLRPGAYKFTVQLRAKEIKVKNVEHVFTAKWSGDMKALSIK